MGAGEYDSTGAAGAGSAIKLQEGGLRWAADVLRRVRISHPQADVRVTARAAGNPGGLATVNFHVGCGRDGGIECREGDEGGKVATLDVLARVLRVGYTAETFTRDGVPYVRVQWTGRIARYAVTVWAHVHAPDAMAEAHHRYRTVPVGGAT